MIFIICFFSSLFLSFFLIQLFKNLFYKYGILDHPEKYGKKRKPVPYSMGIILFITFFVCSCFFVEHNSKLILLWIFGFIISILSFIDDMIDLDPKIRLFFQILVGAVIGITSIKIGYISSIFGGIIDLETYYFTVFNTKIYLIPLLFTILWYVFIFNSLNFTDGVPGNTSGISIISFFILFLLGLILYYRDNYDGANQNAYFILFCSIILVGMLIPFWYYDVQEKILMGDSGTMFLAFMLASLAIISGGKIATVLVVFGIYAVDAIYVIIRRILKGKNPMKKDFTHLHHRLLQKGFSNIQVLFFTYSLSFFFGITSLFLDKIGKIIVFVIIVFIVVFLNSIIDNIKKFKK